MTKLRVEVRTKGSTKCSFQIAGPNPTVPRVGEYVELPDGVARVSAVTWKHADALIVVECAHVPGRKPLP